MAKLIQILPLIGLTMIHSGQSVASYMPYILFYTALKTGLLFVNSLGHVQNSFKITSISMLLAASCWCLIVIGHFAVVVSNRYGGFYLGGQRQCNHADL